MLHLALAALAIAPAAQGKGGGLPPMRQLLGSLSFDKTDVDKDKALSRDEVTKGTFTWLDKNNDKSLDVNELAKLPAEKSARQEARDNEDERKEKKGNDPKDKKKEKDAPPMIALGQDGAPGKDGEPGKKGADGKKEERKDSKDDAKLSPAKQHMERMDVNKDGKVTVDEFALPDEWWGSVDADRDGKISKDEFLGKVKNTDADDAKKRSKGIKLANMSPDEAMAELDTNKDGRVSEEEWTLNAKLFEKVDADADGSLSKDEVAKAIAAAKQLMKGRSPADESKGEGDKPAEKKPSDGGEVKKPAPKPGENPPL